jgi:hypothetical protein
MDFVEHRTMSGTPLVMDALTDSYALTLPAQKVISKPPQSHRDEGRHCEHQYDDYESAYDVGAVKENLKPAEPTPTLPLVGSDHCDCPRCAVRVRHRLAWVDVERHNGHT